MGKTAQYFTLRKVLHVLLVSTSLHILFIPMSVAQRRPARDRPQTTTARLPKSDKSEQHQAPLRSQPPPSPQTTDMSCQVVLNCSPLVLIPEFAEVDYAITPVYVRKEAVVWSLWYVGAQYNSVWLRGEVAEEYEKGFSLGGVVGFILPDGLGLEFGFQSGSFSGTPKFDYVTTMQYANGDMSVTQEIPDRMTAIATSVGVKASYQWLQKEIGSQIASGWRVGTSLRYMWFSEEAMLTQEKLSNGRPSSSRAHTVENFFQRPVLGAEISTTTSVASRWWIDITAGYEIGGNNPNRSLPTVFDWNDYTGQIQLGVSLKVKMGEFPSTLLF